MEQAELVQKRFDSELALLRANQAKSVLEAALRQTKFDLRQAQQEQILYSGSFRAFRDRLTGKQEEAETALRHAVQKAEADLASAGRELAAAQIKIPALEATLSQLPPWDALRSPETEALWCRLEVLYCAEMLVPLLETNRLLLIERRNQFNGTYDGEVKSLHTIAQIYSAPEAAGEACRPCILRLKAALDALEIPFAPGSYFDNPTFFLSSATKFTRMDRINTAIGQVEAIQRLIPKLQKQLSD